MEKKKDYKIESRTTFKAPRNRITREYDFLQHIRLVMKWAMINHDLIRGEIEILLYFYPIGVFTKREFSLYYRTYGMYQNKAFDKLVEEGWITIWRTKAGKRAALYCLTTRAKVLCGRMHKFCTGEVPVPESTKNLLTKGEGKPRIHGYYMDAIRKMNKEREKQRKEKGDDEN